MPVALISFVDADTKAIARIHDPEKHGDFMKGRRTMVEVALAAAAMRALGAAIKAMRYPWSRNQRHSARVRIS